MRSSATVILASVLAAGALAAAGDQTFGKGVQLKDATAIADLYATPEKFVGKSIRVDGVVTAVCEEMGCWMALAAKDAPAQTVRAKVEDGVIVFPLSARGKHASIEGVFEKMAAGDAHSKEAASEQAAKDGKAPAFSQTYQVKATGAVVR
jgi:hypothetical protein